MIDGDTLRKRVMTVLGAGLLISGPGCSGSDSTNAREHVTAAAGHGGTAGSAGAMPGSAGIGRPVDPGSGGSGGNAGDAGNAGMISAAGGPICAVISSCFSYAQIAELLGTGNAGGDSAGAAGATAAGEGGMGNATAGGGALNEAGAGGQAGPFPCPPGPDLGLYVGSGSNVGPPIPEPGMCCYESYQCHMGRPFTVEGAPRTARVLERADWKAQLDPSAHLEPAPLDAQTSALLARSWLDDALAEHASIASFARLTLELLQHAAPPALVQRAQLAALDEIEHARLCFAQSSRYAGAHHGPGPLSLEAALGQVDLPALAASAVREGCVGETLAALVAAEQARAATDPAARAALLKIADDEARHAELAWQIVSWALSEGGAATRAAVEAAFAAATSGPASAVTSGASTHARLLRAHGCLSAAERGQIAARALRDVVSPCARALLLS